MQRDDIAAFERDGLVIRRGLIPRETCDALAQQLWKALGTKHGIREDAPETWNTPLPRGLGKARKAGAFDALGCEAFIRDVDDLLGQDSWDRPAAWGEPLPLFPSPGPWQLPASVWHLDYPVQSGLSARFAAKALCLVAPLAPRGGGTLLVQGSHHLCRKLADEEKERVRIASALARKRLAAQYPRLAELFRGEVEDTTRRDRFVGIDHEVDGVPTRVVEFTGEAGDVVFFHPWLVHNFSPNTTAQPRLMLGQNLPSAEAMQLYARAPDAVG